MAQIRITKEFSFEMAHALCDYPGKCKHIHGHTYQLSVTVVGEVVDDQSSGSNGMVMDFGELKRLVNQMIIEEFDHTLAINENDSRREKLQGLGSNIRFTAYQPTSENLILDFVKRIKTVLKPNLKLHSVRLRETPTSYAEWYDADNN